MIGALMIQAALLLFFGSSILFPLYEYFRDDKRLRRFPSVSIAALSNSWMVIHQFFHTRTLAVHDAHKKNGKVVRIGRDHISMATLQACRDIYGHGTPTTKATFYTTFRSTHLNISDSTDKVVHNSKRKRFATSFAQKSITELEYIVADHLRRLVTRLDEQCSPAATAIGLPKPEEMIDLKHWVMLFAYDNTSMMLYSEELNFLHQGDSVATAETIDGRLYKADPNEAIRKSLRLATALGWAPRSSWLIKLLTKWHPDWKQGTYYQDISIHLMRKRLHNEAKRIAAGGEPLDDLFSTLLYTRDKEPLGLEFGEILTESSNLLNAGSSNLEVEITNISWLLVRNPRVLARLREELESAYDQAEMIPAYEEIKNLPYLRACIDEGMRLRPAIPIGLPRVVPSEGLFVGGEWLEGNTTVSVSTYTLHHDPQYFSNPDEYRPERWLEPDAADLQKVFLAFQQGGRACIGRNIAYLTMQMVIATLVMRYDFALPNPDWVLKSSESIIDHTEALPMKLWRRDNTVAATS